MAEIQQQRKKAGIIGYSNFVNDIRSTVSNGDAISLLTWFDIHQAVVGGRVVFVPLSDKRLVVTFCIYVAGSAPLTTILSLASEKTHKSYKPSNKSSKHEGCVANFLAR
ncbi:hypothetical protein RA27_17920 [Ruegeria sp. ANG-R]|uniref:hypothetical protein n=1 Tax=Ruegeria sp. ANG-R TaxID=1577903 RepID=UPI00057ED5C6|nr:hypothetical protein [Ruegeria sp. ANG-R]KIC39033.1 hypothetical protein RA27_17920 [Ruegeria sp. ANG-R]